MTDGNKKYTNGYNNNAGYFSMFVIALLLILSFIGSLHNIYGIQLYPIASHLTFGLLTVSTLILIIVSGLNIGIFKKDLFISIALFSILVLASTFNSYNPSTTLTRAIQYIIVVCSLYIIISKIEDLRLLFKHVAKIGIYIALISALYGIIIYHTGTYGSVNGIQYLKISFGYTEFTQRIFGERIASFYGNPNPFATRLAIGVILALYLYRSESKLKCITWILILLYALFLSGSRASLIALLVAIMAYWTMLGIKKNSMYHALQIVFLSLGVAFAYVIISDEVLATNFFNLLGRDTGTLSGREIAWIKFIENIKENPFLGVGYRVSPEAILESNKINIFNSHNLYLAIFAELGIAGLILFIYTHTRQVIIWHLNHAHWMRDSLYITLNSIVIFFLFNQIFEEMYSPSSYVFIVVWISIIMFNQLTMNDKRGKIA